MLKVLIVDDSGTSRRLLRHIITSAPDMDVVGEAENGKQAIEKTRLLKPNIILMDIVMPEMDGLEATREIMVKHPTPIVMVSGAIEGRETEMAFRAIKQGALTLMPKPVGPADPAYGEQSEKLLTTIRAMAGVRVIHHIPKERPRRKDADTTTTPLTPIQQTIATAPEILAVAASTGGPAALAEIFQHLPADFSLPIVVVQHIAGDFLMSLMSWLNQVSPLNVKLAEAEDIPQAGNIYFAPFGKHLCFTAEKRFCLRRSPIVRHIPSADVMFESVARRYGAAAIGVILTGMGADGASGLYQMRQEGAITIAQNEQTCAVYGMPKEAVEMGAAQYTLPLSGIAPMLVDISTVQKERGL